MLVALAAAGLYFAARPAPTVPKTQYVIARHTIAPGHRLTSADVQRVAVDLPQAITAIKGDEIDTVVGQVSVARIPQGALVHADFIARGTRAKVMPLMSFAIDPDRAAAGDLVPGDRIDLLATFQGATEANTEIIARGLTVAAVSQPERDTLGSDAKLVLSISIPGAVDAVALTRAIRTAELTVIRTTGAKDAS